MTHEILTTVTLALVALNGLALVPGTVVIVRDVREVARLTRAVAGLVIQDVESTRAQIPAAGAGS